jgi:hypothetical protein
MHDRQLLHRHQRSTEPNVPSWTRESGKVGRKAGDRLRTQTRFEIQPKAIETNMLRNPRFSTLRVQPRAPPTGNPDVRACGCELDKAPYPKRD